MKALLNMRSGAYIAAALVVLVVALALGVSFSVSVLIATACGIIVQQVADERWLRRLHRNDSGEDTPGRQDLP